MIVFLDEDRSYLSWLAHHRHGFVLDWLRRPTHKQPTIHRANCVAIKLAKSKRTHWTTGRHLKACSLDLDELVAWANEEGASGVEFCEQCRPNETVQTASHDRHLTKLGKEVVDFVIEAAVVHLDEHDAGYRMTVADIAQCLDKTPGQISATLRRLIEDGYLRLEGGIAAADDLPNDRRVFPTVESLRSLPAYGAMPDDAVQEELKSLEEE